MSDKIMVSFLRQVFIVLVLLTSCKRSDAPKILTPGLQPYYVGLEKSISNVKTVPLSLIGQKIEYIPLETNPSSLLTNIRDIALTDSFAFISDINKLLQFDRSGRFIRQIGTKGRGPGEYTGVWDYCIDESKNLIYIPSTQGGHKLLVFDFNGKFKKSINLPFKPLSLIQIDTSRLMFYMGNMTHPKLDTAYSWYVTDINGDTLLKIRNFTKRERIPGYMVLEAPLYMFDKSAHFMEFGVDTLYSLKGLKKEAYAVFNFGQLKMDTDPDILNDQLREEYNKKYWIRSIFEDGENIYINFVKGLGGPECTGVFSKPNCRFTMLENGVFNNDIDNGLPFWPKGIINDSTMVMWIEPKQLREHVASDDFKNDIPKYPEKKKELEIIAERLSDFDNPVLMFVTSKNK